MKEEQTSNLQRQLMTTEQQLREKNETEENLQGRLRVLERQVTHFQAQMREKESEEVSLDGQLRGKDHQIEKLQRRLNEKEQQQTNLQWQLIEKNLLEASLQEQLARKEEQVANSEVQLWRLNQRVGTLEEQLRTKHQAVTELELTLSTAQQALNEYQGQHSPDWVISRHQIQLTDKILGRGGWGSVVEGKYCGCTVAVKQIYELILSPHNRSLFEREMDIASRCRHPCLLQFIGATNDEGSPLFVTELMESSLRALLEQRPLFITEVFDISLDVARALNYLHQKEPSPIIHRDISSANVLLWRQGYQWRGKVSDYGTANFMQQTMTVAPGAMIYSAPETLTPNQTVKVGYDLM